MSYTIDGSSFREIAERRFATDDSLNTFENKNYPLPFSRHAVQHTYSRNFGIIRFKADFLQDIKVSNVRDRGHVSLHFQRKGSSMARFNGIKDEQPLQAGQYDMYFAEDFHSDLYFKRQDDFEYLAITLQADYLLQILDHAGNKMRKIEQAIKTGAPFALSGKAMTVGPALNMALHSLLHSPVADGLTEMFTSAKVTEIIALQLSQYAGTTAVAKQISPSPKSVEEAYEYINQHFLSISSPADVVKHITLTEHQLKQGLKAYYHTTLYELVHRKRMLHALQLLRDTAMNVNEVAWEIGYSNATNFIQAFKRNFGVTPHRVKAGK